MSQWYCQLDGKSLGPYSFEELLFLKNRGKLTPDVQVRRGGAGTWMPAAAIPHLFPSDPDAAKMLTSSGVLEPQAEVPHERAVETEESGDLKSSSGISNEPRPQPPIFSGPGHRRSDESQQRMLIGSSILVGILLLLLLFLFLLSFDRDSISDAMAKIGSSGRGTAGVDTGGGETGSGEGSGEGESEGDAAGSGEGEGSGGDEGGGGGDGNVEDTADGSDEQGEDLVDPSEQSEEPLMQEESVGDSPPEDDPPPTTLFRVQELESTLPAEARGEGQGAGAGGGQGDDGAGTLGGVKVKGKIALVCDVSGSMSSDFPVLVRALRTQFPKDTPLLLVNGCIFSPPNPNAQWPTKLAGAASGARRGMPMGIPMGMPMRLPSQFLGVDFTGDQHVYYAHSTTDAILFAVQELARETVMFNNDLQDGGSLKAVKAFEDLHRKQPFVLSGRSLNRNAPPGLHKFIKKSGGEFKLDPIGRAPQPAVQWQR